MKKITTFWYVLKNSLTNFRYYQDIRVVSFSFSLQYFSGIVALVTAISTIGVLIQISQAAPSAIQQVPTYYRSSVKEFPASAEITITQGVVSLNREEPLGIGAPFQAGEERYRAFLVVDPNARPEDLAPSDAFMLLNRDSIIVPADTDPGYEVLPLPKSLDSKVTKTDLLNFEESLNSFSSKIVQNWLGIMIVVAPFIISFSTISQILSGLIVLSILTVFMLLISKVAKLSYSYSDLYKFGMHAMTPMLIFQLFPLFIPQISTEWSILLYSAWMIGAMLSLKKQQ